MDRYGDCMFTYISVIFVINECKYTNPMDPMGTYTYHLAIPQPEKPVDWFPRQGWVDQLPLDLELSFSPKVWGEKQAGKKAEVSPPTLWFWGFWGSKFQIAPHLGSENTNHPWRPLSPFQINYCIKQLTLNEWEWMMILQCGNVYGNDKEIHTRKLRWNPRNDDLEEYYPLQSPKVSGT